jgi:hypothetical protein
VRGLLIVLVLASCDDDPSSVIVEIHSDLQIPREANSLIARVQHDGHTIAEETYSLGEPPRDRWPQTLPLIAGSTYDDRVTLAAEARIALSGPSVVAGFGEIEVIFPESGTETIRFELPRSCIDEDDDGYGIGFGCKRPDCDDANVDIPERELCPGFVVPDAGTPDVGPKDGGPDAGPEDGGAPIDGGAPDAGGFGCGATTCGAGQTCLGDMCWKSCATNEDCGDLSLGCLENFGVCICRAPCFNGQEDCGTYECIDGCCDI